MSIDNDHDIDTNSDYNDYNDNENDDNNNNDRLKRFHQQ